MYTDIQCIAYEVKTVRTEPSTNPFDPPYTAIWDHMKDPGVNCRLDIVARCALLSAAIKLARPQAALAGSILKVFMAPELFFRGPHGAYPIEMVSEIMIRMRKATSAPIYKHWLFILGTAVAFLEGDAGTEVFNLAMVQKGGVAESRPGTSDLIVYKEYISYLDFVHKVSNDDWKNHAKRVVRIAESNKSIIATHGSRDVKESRKSTITPYGAGTEYNTTGLGGGSIFTLDKITFGLEVCADHYEGRIKASPPAKGQPKIQVHLICAAGAQIEASNVMSIRPGGLVFYVDGDDRAPAVVEQWTNEWTTRRFGATDTTAVKRDASKVLPAGAGKIRVFPVAKLPKPQLTT